MSYLTLKLPQALWAPLRALPGARRRPAYGPSEDDLRRRLQAYQLRRLRQAAHSSVPLAGRPRWRLPPHP